MIVGPVEARGAFFGTIVRYLLGDDIFVSYSRADALTYAAGLADVLTKRGFSCYLDQWGTPPGRELPATLKRSLRRSALLVVIGTERAAVSDAVGQEVAEFVKNKRPVIPIDFGGTLDRAVWFPLIAGSAKTPETLTTLTSGEPSPAIVSRIEKSCSFTRRNQRVRRAYAAA